MTLNSMQNHRLYGYYAISQRYDTLTNDCSKPLETFYLSIDNGPTSSSPGLAATPIHVGNAGWAAADTAQSIERKIAYPDEISQS